MGKKVWDDYFVFCFERNPYDKAISYYHWWARSEQTPPPLVEHLRTMPSNQFSDWTMYTIDGHLAMDFVGRYEQLTEDLEEVRCRVGLPTKLTLPRAKGSVRKDRRPYPEVLGGEERALIDRACAREIEAFGYAF